MHIRWLGVVEVIAALAATTAVVWVLEVGLGLERASALYLLAVAVVAIRQGTTAALLTALGAFVIYNLLFVEPRFTLAVARPEELITLFLLLFVGSSSGAWGVPSATASASPRSGSERLGRCSRSRESWPPLRASRARSGRCSTASVPTPG